MSHYGCAPYDALYGGYFLDISSARQYCMLYMTTDKEPYHKNNLSKQVGRSRQGSPNQPRAGSQPPGLKLAAGLAFPAFA